MVLILIYLEGNLRYNHKLRCIGISYQKNDWWEWFKLAPIIVEQTVPVYIVFTGDYVTWSITDCSFL